MALKPCKECNKSVSTTARTCPHCGVANPTTTSTRLMLGLGMIVVLSWLAFGGDNEARKEQANKKCMQTLKCWGQKHYLTGGALCKPQVERRAKYSHEWTDGALESKFTRYRWRNRDTGVITIIGDRIKFQNALGAYQNMIYECDFDPINEHILDVRVTEGYLASPADSVE